jgi:hypothetical protein
MPLTTFEEPNDSLTVGLLVTVIPAEDVHVVTGGVPEVEHVARARVGSSKTARATMSRPIFRRGDRSEIKGKATNDMTDDLECLHGEALVPLAKCDLVCAVEVLISTTARTHKWSDPAFASPILQGSQH